MGQNAPGPDFLEGPIFLKGLNFNAYGYILLYIKSNFFRFVERKINELQGEGARENFPQTRLFPLRGWLPVLRICARLVSD